MYKIWIWGAGKYSNIFMNYYYPLMKNYFSVEGVIESKTEGKQFGDYQIIQADRFFLNKYDYDYIVVMNNFYSEIIEYLNSHRFYNDKVIHMDEFFRMFNEFGFWRGKSIGFVGDVDCKRWFRFHSCYLFDKVIFFDSYEIDKDCDYYFICPPRLISDDEKINYEKNVIEEIKSHYHVASEKILCFDAWKWYFQADICIRNNNNGEKFLIIAVSDPIQGWGNIIFRVLAAISYAKRYGFEAIVDMKYCDNQYVREVGDVNAWELFFEQPTKHSLEEAYASDNVYITGINTHMDERITASLPPFKNSFYKEYLEQRRTTFKDNKRILGVIYRGTDYYRAAGHPKPFTDEEFIDLVKKEYESYNYDMIFLATEVEEMTWIMKNEFKEKVCFTNQLRYSSAERRLLSKISFNRENDEYLRAKEYLIVIMLLSECNGLLGQDTGTFRAAELINENKYERIVKI